MCALVDLGDEVFVRVGSRKWDSLRHVSQRIKRSDLMYVCEVRLFFFFSIILLDITSGKLWKVDVEYRQEDNC